MAYFRRFRMEIDLSNVRLSQPVLPEHYHFTSWHRSLLDRHAAVKFESFRGEIDSLVFPCLGASSGCQRLMDEIARQKSFLPEATWLVSYCPGGDGPTVDCGTIQGLAQNRRLGAVQNVGVVSAHRGLGLGRALVLQALHGFRRAGLRRGFLEVTAENKPAVELYRRIGFCLCRTMYKPMPTEVTFSF